MRNLDTIETLETFVVLARLNSVGKTAEQLHISKASVSRRISSLETSIGELFIRNQNGSELTPLGCLFLEKIQPFLERFHKLSAPVSRPEGSISGSIRISAPNAIGNGLLIPWITAFQRRNPELFVNLTLTLGPMHIIPPECDIRINHGLYPCSNAVIRKLGEMRRMMVASAAYLAKHGVPKTPEDLEFHELLGGNDLVNGAPLVLLKDNERVIVPIHSKLRLKDHTAARTAALFDAGISVHAFRYDTMELVRRKLLIHVLPDWEPEPSPVSLLLPIGRKPSSAVEALCDFIAEKWRSNPELVFDHGL